MSAAWGQHSRDGVCCLQLGTVQQGQCLLSAAGDSSGDRENQWPQRLRTSHNLPILPVQCEETKTTQQPPQGMWQSRGPWGLSHRLVSKNI